MLTIRTATEPTGTDIAECWHAGAHVRVRSRHGSVFALCRQLIADGIADQPAEVYAPSGTLAYRLESIAAAAKTTIEDSDGGMRAREYRDFAGRTPQSGGSGEPDGVVGRPAAAPTL